MLNAPFSQNGISISKLVSTVKKDGIVFGGKISKNVKKIFTAEGIEVIDYLDREEFSVLNAVPTAEGAIQLALEEMPATIYGSKILITGFGRISKILVKLLTAMGADVTVAYRKAVVPAIADDAFVNNQEFYYTLTLEDGKVTDININEECEDEKNLSMNMYVLRKDLLLSLIKEAHLQGHVFFERDVLLPKLGKLDVQAFEFTGYVASFHDLKSYFKTSMDLLDQEKLDGLFGPAPIYTKVRDDNPTRYVKGCEVKNTMAADGCVIEGEVENCILFKGVKIGKGAEVKNCILMQDTVIGEGVELEYVITDKNVTITKDVELEGAENFPIYVGKGKTI